MNLDDFPEVLTRQEALHPDLVPYLRSGGLGTMLHHPLTIQVIYHEGLNTLINAQYTAKKQAIDRYLTEGRFSTAVFTHERPYRFDALTEYMRDYDFARHPDFWPTVGSIWTDSENIYESFEDWQWVWESDTPGREKVMSEDERAALAALPETITVYRGVNGRHDERTEVGMSWTTDHAKAEWFAKRFNHDDEKVLRAQVNKSDVLAHFIGRNESEIVVLPDAVTLL